MTTVTVQVDEFLQIMALADGVDLSQGKLRKIYMDALLDSGKEFMGLELFMDVVEKHNLRFKKVTTSSLARLDSSLNPHSKAQSAMKRLATLHKFGPQRSDSVTLTPKELPNATGAASSTRTASGGDSAQTTKTSLQARRSQMSVRRASTGMFNGFDGIVSVEEEADSPKASAPPLSVTESKNFAELQQRAAVVGENKFLDEYKAEWARIRPKVYAETSKKFRSVVRHLVAKFGDLAFV